MNGQYLGGRPISLSYAFKKDGQKGERHGSTAERRLADLGKKNNVLITGFLPPSGLAALANMPPIPTGFNQAGNAPAQGGPPQGPPMGAGYAPPAPPPGFNAPSVAAPGQGGFGPPPGMPPPPAGFNQFGR